MRTVALFVLTLAGVAAVADDASAFGKRRRGEECCGGGYANASPCAGCGGGYAMGYGGTTTAAAPCCGGGYAMGYAGSTTTAAPCCGGGYAMGYGGSSYPTYYGGGYSTGGYQAFPGYWGSYNGYPTTYYGGSPNYYGTPGGVYQSGYLGGNPPTAMPGAGGAGGTNIPPAGVPIPVPMPGTVKPGTGGTNPEK